MKALLVLTSLTDIYSAIILFIVYYVNHGACEKEKDFKKIEEIVLTLLLSASIIVIANFIYFVYYIAKLVRLVRRKINRTRWNFCVHFSMLFLACVEAAIGSIFTASFTGLYFCQIKQKNMGLFCDIDIDFVFGNSGYHLMSYFLSVYLFGISCLVIRLSPLFS
jgi:hypothetical protein